MLNGLDLYSPNPNLKLTVLRAPQCFFSAPCIDPHVFPPGPWFLLFPPPDRDVACLVSSFTSTPLTPCLAWPLHHHYNTAVLSASGWCHPKSPCPYLHFLVRCLRAGALSGRFPVNVPSTPSCWENAPEDPVPAARLHRTCCWDKGTGQAAPSPSVTSAVLASSPPRLPLPSPKSHLILLIPKLSYSLFLAA